MTSITLSSPLSSSPEISAYPGGSLEFNVSPELNGRYDPTRRVLWFTMSPRGVPNFSLPLLRDLSRSSVLIEQHFSPRTEDPLRYLVLRSTARGVFNLGGDLNHFADLIAERDRHRLEKYAAAAVHVAYRNYTAHNLGSATTIALLEGDALGGGFESALSCDIVIAERHVRCGFPEVLFDMFPGMGAFSFVSRRAQRSVLNELTRSGRQFPVEELAALGLIDRVVDTGQGEEAVHRLMREREHQSHGQAAMNRVDKLVQPVTLAEMQAIAAIWVDCAMQLSTRSLAWMRRLYRQQVANFGHANTVMAAD